MSFLSIISKFINSNNQNQLKETFSNPTEEYKLENFCFERATNRLSFNIIKYSYKPKIARYVQSNYKRRSNLFRHPQYKHKKNILILIR